MCAHSILSDSAHSSIACDSASRISRSILDCVAASDCLARRVFDKSVGTAEDLRGTSLAGNPASNMRNIFVDVSGSRIHVPEKGSPHPLRKTRRQIRQVGVVISPLVSNRDSRACMPSQVRSFGTWPLLHISTGMMLT